MKKNNEIKTVVPALRFPEFRDTESWDNDVVNNLVDIITPPKKIILQEYLNEGDYPIVDQSQKYISGWTNDKTAIISKAFLDNPIIIFGDHTCILKKITFPFAQGADGIKVLKSKDTIDGNFLYQALLACPVVQEEYKRHFSILKQKEVFFPSIESGEQQKIADCLSSLDELIEATTQKVEALKEHKKGLMQRLFPAGGKNVPDLRFPEFQGTSVWEEKKLGNVVEIKGRIGFRGYTTKDIVEQGKGAISLSPTNITENGNLNFDKSSYISWKKYNESPEIQLQKGFIVLVKTGSSYGKSALVKELPTKTTVNPQIVVLKPKEGVNEYFISVLISHPMIQKQIKCAVVGGAIPTLSQESISRFDVLYPKKTSYKPSEQEKIADCLSSLDELIEATSRKVEILKEHKKGLMQQLFPKFN